MTKQSISKKRIKTGNWRPFRPAGMSDGAWRTILLLHRFPTDDMDEEERSHCLGPMLFGKGAARFGDYGRGWIQEQADALLNSGKTPYAMDVREWRKEIIDAMDYYNGMYFDDAKKNGIAESEADFFVSNIPIPDGDGRNPDVATRYLYNQRKAKASFDQIWHTICYAPYGSGPWHLMTEGVLNGWKDVFSCCDEVESFCDVAAFDWRCAAMFDDDDVLDVRMMTEICPICPNTAIFGGIECACDLLEDDKLETSFRRKTVRYLKRAFSELYKRRAAVLKTTERAMDIASFDSWLQERIDWAVGRCGEAVRPNCYADIPLGQTNENVAHATRSQCPVAAERNAEAEKVRDLHRGIRDGDTFIGPDGKQWVWTVVNFQVIPEDVKE